MPRCMSRHMHARCRCKCKCQTLVVEVALGLSCNSVLVGEVSGVNVCMCVCVWCEWYLLAAIHTEHYLLVVSYVEPNETKTWIVRTMHTDASHPVVSHPAPSIPIYRVVQGWSIAVVLLATTVIEFITTV